MKKNFLYSAFIFIACLPAALSAQTNIPEFGKVDIADLQMKECPFDKEADAMYLLNYEKATFTFNFGNFLEIEKWQRIKIFKQSGLKYSTIVIPYITKNKQSKISRILAYVYNLDAYGNVIPVKIERADIFREKSNEEGSVRFAFPGVKPGSIVELRYTEKESNTLYLAPWFFQEIIPTRLSVCKLSYDGNTNIDTHFTGNAMPEEKVDTERVGGSEYLAVYHVDYDKIDHSYLLKNVSSYRDEPLMTSRKDNLEGIEFSALTARGLSMKDYVLYTVQEKWSFFNQRLLQADLFGGQFEKSIPGTQLKIDSIKTLPSISDKLDAIYNWVKNKVKWDGTKNFFLDDINKVWKDGEATSTEINLIMLNIMRKAGLVCYPVLVGSRGNGAVNMNFPSLGQFDGMDIIVKDSTHYYVVDVTQKYQGYKIPPFNVLNTYGLIIDKDQCRWIKIEDDRPLMRNVISIKASIDSTGTMYGQVFEFFYDYAKVDILSSREKEDASAGKDLLEKDITGIKIDSLKEDNADNDEKPLVKSFKFQLVMEQTGDDYFFDPFFLSPFKKNPFMDVDRRTDIDFGCNQSYSIGMYITVPENIEISDLPANKQIRLADTSFSFNRFTAQQNNAVVIRNRFELNSAVFTVDQYPFVKQVFEKVYSLLNDRIVFKRKE